MSEQDLVFDRVARYFALFSVPGRLRILHAVCDAERTVSEIVAHTGSSRSRVSRTVRLMRERGALSRRQEGRRVLYRVADLALIEMCRNVCQRVTEAQGTVPADGAPSLPEGSAHRAGPGLRA